ncbi:hypothetical protein OOK36_55415 [Streptomyces sp. NBC_00365]|uniref:hypothetical protein n=1 Tax=Streptomyces sp. NBC_00365 TaxID=2975726 RepID=UPI00225705A1|nr:hypothetical protein [Streptomyces sp. NBC_00365]MCX5097645.1 hypothetical protein [Streptomyces sp. NBC_00365]
MMAGRPPPTGRWLGGKTWRRASARWGCASSSRSWSRRQITALQAEIVRIDAAAEAGLAPYPIAAREQQRRAHLTDIIRRHDAQQPGVADPEELR